MRRVKLLIVEDNSSDRRIMEAYLSGVNDTDFVFTHAFRLKEAFNHLNLDSFDIVTLDLGLPDSYGLETFEKFHSAFPNVPTIVISGYEDPEIAKAVIENGAHGFLVKGKFTAESLVKEINLAINKQSFRTRVSSRLPEAKIVKSQKESNDRELQVVTNSEAKVSLTKQAKGSSLIEREPVIFHELVEEYLPLIPLSSTSSPKQIKEKVNFFFQEHKEALSMLGLTKSDFNDLHRVAISRLNFVDKGNPNFKSLTAILLQEINLFI